MFLYAFFLSSQFAIYLQYIFKYTLPSLARKASVESHTFQQSFWFVYEDLSSLI